MTAENRIEWLNGVKQELLKLLILVNSANRQFYEHYMIYKKEPITKDCTRKIIEIYENRCKIYGIDCPDHITDNKNYLT